MKEMFETLEKVKGQREVLRTKWTPLVIAKAYLTLYQPNYQDLWKTTIPDSKYDTLNALADFKGRAGFDSINESDLVSILQTLNK